MVWLGSLAGAVYVAVAGDVVVWLVSVPMLPSDGMLVALEVVVFPLLFVVVVVYCGVSQVTPKFVAPVTVAVKVVEDPTIMVVPEDEVTATETTLALPPPQPFNKAAQIAAIASTIKSRILRDFITLASPRNTLSLTVLPRILRVNDKFARRKAPAWSKRCSEPFGISR